MVKNNIDFFVFFIYFCLIYICLSDIVHIDSVL